MNNYSIGADKVQTILTKFHLEQLVTFEEMKAGMITPVYLINGKYILRIEQHTFEHNANKLKREALLFEKLPKFDIPTPRLFGFDESKQVIDSPYIVLEFIPGENLEQFFNKLSQTQQTGISFQLGSLARKIHTVTPENLHNPLFGTLEEWVKKSIADFNTYWHIVKDTQYLSQELKTDIWETYEQFKQLNWDNAGRLTHGDFTAGNVQVYEGRIVGIFDFEFSFIADPLWDLQKLSSHFQLGQNFSREEFLKGYGKDRFSHEEKTRIKMHSYQQGVWEIWANLTHFMPSTDKDIKEGIQIIQSTANYNVLN